MNIRFGQPGRVAGIVVGEWEERSPWPPLAERRGVAGDAVTVHGCIGTMDVADILADSGAVLAEMIGKSIAYPATNAFISPWGAEVMIALAPPWADLIAADFADLADAARELWTYAALPVSWWPPLYHERLERHDRIDESGMVHLVERPEDVIIIVCGGLGNLHAMALHSFGPTKAVTRGFQAPSGQ